jgi:hypothetical protein
MKPYLMLYLQSFFSFVTIIKNNATFLLNSKLKKFQKFNPKFGRKIYKLGFKFHSNFKRTSYLKSVHFLDNHIAFNCDEEANFLTNHTSYNEINNIEEETQFTVTYQMVSDDASEATGEETSDEEDNEIYHNYHNYNDEDEDEDEDDSVS